MTASHIAGLFVESFAADGEESIGLWVEDFQMTLTGLRAAQTNRVLAGQTLARSSLLGRAHASSVLSNEAIVLTGSLPLLGSLSASRRSVANGPGSPFAEEGADSHVARQKFHIGSVAVQSASGCFGGWVDAASSSDLDSSVAAHGTLTVVGPGVPFGRRSLLLAVLSFPL